MQEKKNTNVKASKFLDNDEKKKPCQIKLIFGRR